MPRRPVWVLVLLAAVFLMHGPPAAAQGAQDGPSTAATARHLPGAEAPVQLPAVAGSEKHGDGVPSHPDGVHLWASCLAVLLAGLGLLAAVRAGGPSAGRRRAARPRAPGMAPRRPPPRPPDLAVLCVLRT